MAGALRDFHDGRGRRTVTQSTEHAVSKEVAVPGSATHEPAVHDGPHDVGIG